jgi:hypothetical protein
MPVITRVLVHCPGPGIAAAHRLNAAATRARLGATMTTNSLPHPGPAAVVPPSCSPATRCARNSALFDPAPASPVRLALFLLLFASSSPAFAQFDGYGKHATSGGRQSVCTVTSSAAKGPGTWQWCVRKGGNQTIQFAVSSANVYETSYLQSNTTVDGCANGRQGVTLYQPANKKRAVAIEGPVSNVVLRCIRFQGSGPDRPHYLVEDDLLRLDGTSRPVSRVVVDHCTFVGATDGALDVTGNVSDVTVSWNLFYNTALTQLVKYKTRVRMSLHHNVYTAGGERNPQIKGNAREIEFVSNAVYDETIRKDGLGNTFNPYGTRLWNGGPGSDSPGNVKANVLSNFWGGAHSGLRISTDHGASAKGIYVAPDNVCPDGCPSSPARAPFPMPAEYAIEATPVGCMVYQMMDKVGSPNRTPGDQSKLNAVAAALPKDCPQALAARKAGNGSGTITSSPAGIGCGGDCSHSYNYETLVTLTAAPAVGSTFAGWRGACAGTGSCRVTMDAAKSVTATFELIPYPLAVAKTGDGSGTVTSWPAGISCGSDCSQPYDYGTVVTLRPSPGQRSAFAGWTGACTGAGPCRVAIESAMSVTAVFKALHDLHVAKSGSGSVTSSPAGISCGTDCAERYTTGTLVTLIPSASSGSGFAGWSGACTGTGRCQVDMSAAKSVTATFKAIYRLTVAKAGSGSVASAPAGISCGPDCSQPFLAGTQVTLTASPASGSAFAGWRGACRGTGTCRVTLGANESVTAVFERLNTLSVAKTGGGAGTVTSSPSGISCGPDCSQRYVSETVVTLSPSPASGSVFTGWRGACSGTGTCRVTMGADRSVTAVFKDLYILSVAKTGSGAGIVTSSPAGISCGSDCSQRYVSETMVTLRPAPASGSSFRGWSGACSGTGTCQVTMTAARSVGAAFTRSASTLADTNEGEGTAEPGSSPHGEGSPGGYYTIVPCRAFDSRNSPGPHGGPALAAGRSRVIALAGTCGIPSSARAVSVNLTVTRPTKAGVLRLYPADVPLPLVFSLAYGPGQTRSNAVIAGLSPSGALAIRCTQPSGTADVTLDVTGYFE